MPSLSKELRRLLEKTIAGDSAARQIAELGAEQSLRRLAVDRHEPHTSLTPEERTLRTQLRAHGRQLGDKRDPQRGSQSIDHLTQAVAYEHWHRLLFARFLAENDLLMHPDHGVALSLDEVKEVALGVGRDWIDIASEYAQRMLLREVFRSDDPALRVPLSPERRLELEKKLSSLPREIFLADDSLGWVYQFWQKDAKDQVNRSEVKIGADELSPVTQLFTEDYMVLFLLENTLGAWWTARRGKPDLAGYQWTYLRIEENGLPAAGTFTGWPSAAKELKILDPCMGSGHFLTFALPIVARMRAEEESSSLMDAVYAVLRENIFGLELDPRCSQIAAFNLALTAWKLCGKHFELPPFNLACSGLGINAKEEQWVDLAGDDAQGGEAMRRLYLLFKDAPTLGSLVDPLRLKANVFAASADQVLPLLEEALIRETSNDEARELAIAAQGVLAAFRIITRQFTLVATNVPYLGRGKQAPLLVEYCDEVYPDAKFDLATCFVDRSLRLCAEGGTVGLVSPQNWIYQVTYSDLISRLTATKTWNLLARLGPKAFQTPMWDFNVMLLAITRSSPHPQHSISMWDVSKLGTADKPGGLRTPPAATITQETAFKVDQTQSLGRVARCYQGISTGDNPLWLLQFWEIPELTGWSPFQTPSSRTTSYGGRSVIVRSEITTSATSGAAIRGAAAWGKRGVAVARMGALHTTLYSGELFANVLPVIIPNRECDLPAVWAFAEDADFATNVRKINQGLNVDNGYFEKVPFDLGYWTQIAAERFPNGLPAPHSSAPNQWLFSGHPRDSDDPLQVAVARLVGYEWPRQTGSNFPGCEALAPDGLERHAASDGIVCLSAVAGEESAGTRVRALLHHAYGSSYDLANLLQGRKSSTIDLWLRDEFFEEHCRFFEQMPFVWHVWDGLKDGFHAFMNYHKLDRRNLEKLIFSYLGDWLTRQRQDVQSNVDGADSRLAAAEHLQVELRRILDGEDPYDIFVRWKRLDKQAIGWEPDLDDGIRMNIRPWITAASLYKALKPGILRVTPNIKYTKDRGKESKRASNEYPWFASSSDRVNDLHLSIAEKRSARGLR